MTAEAHQSKQPNKPAKRSLSWFWDWPFRYIDSFQSESKRRISHGLVVATLVAVAGYLWSRRDSLIDNGENLFEWLKSLLRSSIQIKIWPVAFTFIGLGWILYFIYWLRSK